MILTVEDYHRDYVHLKPEYAFQVSINFDLNLTVLPFCFDPKGSTETAHACAKTRSFDPPCSLQQIPKFGKI